MDSPPKRWSVAAKYRYARAHHVALALLTDHAESDPRLSVAYIVDEQACRAAVVCHHNINIPIVVDVSKRCTPADSRQRSNPGKSQIWLLPLESTKIT